MRRIHRRLLATLGIVLLLSAAGGSTALARPSGPVPNDVAYYGKWIYSSQLPYTDVSDVTQATVDAFDVNNTCSSDDPGNTVWYRFRATSSVDLVLDTFGSSYDTEITVFTTNLQYIDCNDDADDITGNPEDANNGYASYLNVQLQGGRTYLIRVGSYDNPAYCQTESSCDGVSDGALVFHVASTNPQ
jgi:hypothetical protein